MLLRPVPLECKFENCVTFNTGFNPFINCHDRSNSPFCNLYLLQVFLDTSEITITLMVSIITMMMMMRDYAVINTNSMWALDMTRVKRENSQPEPVSSTAI